MTINMTQWVADIIRQRKVAAIPVMTHPGIELNGHTVRQAVSDGNIHYQAVMTLAKQCIICTYMCLVVENFPLTWRKPKSQKPVDV